MNVFITLTSSSSRDAHRTFSVPGMPVIRAFRISPSTRPTSSLKPRKTSRTSLATSSSFVGPAITVMPIYLDKSARLLALKPQIASSVIHLWLEILTDCRSSASQVVLLRLKCLKMIQFMMIIAVTLDQRGPSRMGGITLR